MDWPVLQFANFICVNQMGSLIVHQYSKRAKPCRQRLWTVGGSFERHQREGSVQFLCVFLLHICNIPHSHSPLVFWKTCYTKDTQVKFPFGWEPVVSHFYFTFLQIYLRFLEYEMHNSNECKRNFVAVYDGSSSVEHLKNKFCSTVANDVMLVTSVGVIRMWADQGSRKSRFRILFTTFLER